MEYETQDYIVRYRKMDGIADAKERSFKDEDRAAAFAKGLQARGYRVSLVREDYAVEFWH